MIQLPAKEKFANKSILVLGASGFLGRWVCACLSQLGLKPHLAMRDPIQFEPICTRWQLKGQVHRLDVTEETSLENLIEATGPQVVFNLVGYGIDRREKDEGLAREINQVFPGRLVEVLKANKFSGKKRLVHVGSALEYGAQENDLVETTPCCPEGLYGTTKLAGSEAVLRGGSEDLEVIVARLFTVFGPGEHPNRLLPSLRRAKNKMEAIDLSDGHQMRDFTEASDVATGLVALGACPDLRFDLINLASGTLRSVREFILTAAQVLNLPNDYLNFGAIPRYADEMQHEPVSIVRCRELLGTVPSSDLKSRLEAALTFEEERP